MIMEELFVDSLLKALDEVEDVHYGNGRWSRGMYPDLTPEQTRTLTAFVTRHLERTFCYELYHQLRLFLPEAADADGITLQAELAKSAMPDWMAALHGMETLRGIYYPDFLYHRPFAGDAQIAVVEAKAKPDVDGTDLVDDINKLGEFIVRYNYGVAIMLTVNASPDRIQRLIRNRGGDIRDEVPREQVLLICKEGVGSETTCQALNTLWE